MVDPARLEEKTPPPPVHIESVIADHKMHSLKQRMRLPALTRDLEIDYTALSLGAPQKVYFRYRLEGRESDWQQPGTRRQAYYTDLRPGSYTFRVIACNSEGVWNEAGDTLEFAIDSAFYQTNWFRAALVAAFFLAMWAAYRLRVASAHAGNSTRISKGKWMSACAWLAICTIRFLQSFQGLIPVFQTARNLLPGQSDRAAEVLDEGLHDAADAIVEGRNAIQNLRGETVAGSRSGCSAQRRRARTGAITGGGGECARIPRGRRGIAAAARSARSGTRFIGSAAKCCAMPSGTRTQAASRRKSGTTAACSGYGFAMTVKGSIRAF